MPGGSEKGGAAKAGRRKKLKKVKDFVLGDVLGEGEESHTTKQPPRNTPSPPPVC
jgi:hypothetical protein